MALAFHSHHARGLMSFSDSFVAGFHKQADDMKRDMKDFAGQFVGMKENFRETFGIKEQLPTVTPRRQNLPTLSMQTQKIIEEGERLLINFNAQGKSLHELSFQQKHVAAKLKDIIDLFKTQKIMDRRKATIAALVEVKEGYTAVNKNIDDLGVKLNEMNVLMGKLFERQQRGKDQEAGIKKEMARLTSIINSYQKQIDTARNNSDRISGMLNNLHGKITGYEAKLGRSKPSSNNNGSNGKKVLLLATVLTLAGTQVAKELDNEIRNAQKEWNQTYRELKNEQGKIDELNRELNSAVDQKASLRDELENQKFELGNLNTSWNRVHSAHRDTAKYRQFLLTLSDAFKQTSISVDHLHSNLNIVNEIQAAGYKPNEDIKQMVNNSCTNLEKSWNSAKKKLAFKIVLKLQDKGNVDATLHAIKNI